MSPVAVPWSLDPLAVAAIAAAVGWLLLLAAVRLARRPTKPRTGEVTLDLGREPPAIANFLVHDFRLTRNALPATLLDLAARRAVELEHRGPGVYVCRLHREPPQDLTGYEQHLLDLLRRRARNGVVPPGALTTGQALDSGRWWARFRREVVADCRERGLSRDLWNARVLTLVGVLGLVPAGLAALAWTRQVGAGVAVGAAAIALRLNKGRRQRETPAGREAASRWLGVRAALRDNPELAETPAITVAIWGRHLAYAAAFGLADQAAQKLGFEPELDERAWVVRDGRWQEVPVSYPRLVPIGWGLGPLAALVRAAVAIAGGVFALTRLAPHLEGALAALLLPPALLTGAGLLLAARALADLGPGEEVSGTIVRLRARSTRTGVRHYVAIHDEASPRTRIRALLVRGRLYAGLAQEQRVAASVTRRLRFVRAIDPMGG